MHMGAFFPFSEIAGSLRVLIINNLLMDLYEEYSSGTITSQISQETHSRNANMDKKKVQKLLHNISICKALCFKTNIAQN